MTLLQLIAQHDKDRNDLIDYLQAQLQDERRRVHELTSLLQQVTASNERKALSLILSGHYDPKSQTISSVPPALPRPA